MSARIRSLISQRCPTYPRSSNLDVRASLKRIDYLPRERKGGNRKPQCLIKLSTAEGKHPGKWNDKFVFSLKELQLQDFVSEEDEEAQVFIRLSVAKHAGYGLSVEGNITLSLPSICSKCGSPYCRQIETNFHTWVLPQPSRYARSGLDIIGGEDPDVIYVKPGQEADIDSVVQDTMRLTLSTYETCSELCKNARRKMSSRGEGYFFHE